MSELLSVKEAAALLKVTNQRVLQLIKAHIVPAQKVGRAYVIRQEDLSGLTWKRNPGRPSKPTVCAICGSNLVCPVCSKADNRKTCSLCGQPTDAEGFFCDQCREEGHAS